MRTPLDVANKLLMRPFLAAILCCAIVVGCAPAQFPTEAQKVTAKRNSLNDKSERIKPEVLTGMWISDKGSVLTFGGGHDLSVRIGLEGKTVRGTYKLEGYKLSLGMDSLGWIGMEKEDQFMLAKTRDDVEHFRKFA